MKEKTKVLVINWIDKETSILLFEERIDAIETLRCLGETLSYVADPAFKGTTEAPTAVSTGDVSWEIIG